MPNDDYIIRMFRQYGATIARMVGLQKTGDYVDALIEIDQSLENLFGFGINIISVIDDESLYKKLSTDEQINIELLVGSL